MTSISVIEEKFRSISDYFDAETQYYTGPEKEFKGKNVGLVVLNHFFFYTKGVPVEYDLNGHIVIYDRINRIVIIFYNSIDDLINKGYDINKNFGYEYGYQTLISSFFTSIFEVDDYVNTTLSLYSVKILEFLVGRKSSTDTSFFNPKYHYTSHEESMKYYESFIGYVIKVNEYIIENDTERICDVKHMYNTLYDVNGVFHEYVTDDYIEGENDQFKVDMRLPKAYTLGIIKKDFIMHQSNINHILVLILKRISNVSFCRNEELIDSYLLLYESEFPNAYDNNRFVLEVLKLKIGNFNDLVYAVNNKPKVRLELHPSISRVFMDKHLVLYIAGYMSDSEMEFWEGF